MILGMGMHEAQRPEPQVWLSGPAEPPEEPAQPVESYDPQQHRPPRRTRLEWDDMDPVPRRIRSSPTTFGLVGRLVVTGVILLYIVMMLETGLFAFFLVAAVPALAWVLKDTWRRADVDRAPAPTQARDLGGRVVARGPDDDLLPNRLHAIVPVLGWDPDAPGSEAHFAATGAEPVASEPVASQPSSAATPQQPATSRPSKDAEWLERLMLDPGLASRVRDKPSVVPPPFPGEGGRAAAQADGSASGSPA
jgi:hypothetical protein